MDDIQFFEVGGAVRDAIMGRQSSDVDFTVIAPSWEALLARLQDDGFRIWQVREQFFTVRAGIPECHPLRSRARDADFVWARKEGPYSDGRRPDWVLPGTLEDDLARRDFTMNAIARDTATGEFIDSHDGMRDIDRRIIRAVGNPMERILEDALRVARGLRFGVAFEFAFNIHTWVAMTSYAAADALAKVSTDRRREEVNKMLDANQDSALSMLARLPEHTRAALLGGIKLLAKQ